MAAIGSREWLLERNPGIFDASKNYTSAQTQQQFQSRPASQTSGVRSQDGYTPVLTGGGHVNWVKNQTSSYPTGGAPTPPGGAPPGGGGGGSRGGGGGGMSATAKGNNILGLINRYKPQQTTWENLAYKDYQPSAYRQFDSAKYERLKKGLAQAIGADRSAGNAQYAQLGEEMAAYQNPWSNPTPQTTNPAMSTAMTRMMQANNVNPNINQADTNRGIQADQGFGNLLAVLGTAAQQEQASRMRSNQGYQRNLNERLDAELRGGNLGVGMAEAQARELYEQEKWEFGESIAQMNFNNRMGIDQYNNQGSNAVSAQNVQGNNAWNQSAIQALIDMIGQGAAIDPNAFVAYEGA